MNYRAGVFSRVLKWDEDLPDAFHVFASGPSQFAALLEGPGGPGRQILVSRAGRDIRIEPEDITDPGAGDYFFEMWKGMLHPVTDSPAIRCLVYAAYEAGGLIEDLPSPKSEPEGPLLWLHVPEWSCRYLPKEREVHIDLVPESGDADRELDRIEALIRQKGSPVSTGRLSVDGIHASDADGYLNAVRKAKEYIRAGDIFQANIARFWSAGMDDSYGPALYAILRRINPAPFSAWVRIPGEDGDMQIVSSSPERLFRVRADGMVETRPIAGTRKRGVGKRDVELRDELLLSEKERAEHVMLVDLERNDLGRVCLPGTIEVNESMVIERYATVQHIVSNVRGRLEKGRDVVDVFRAMFPGGTITGCPKVRCMQIIHELEGQARGPYTGSVGYVCRDGSADMNILIRTFWLNRNRLHWAAGAGIVADSDPEAELDETEHKAAGLMRALARAPAT
jgi:anthranilate synthase component 1